MATKKSDILSKLKENYLFAVVRGKSSDDAYEISKGVYEGGVKNIEVTFTTPQADETIRQLAKEYADTDMVIGAGTVLDAVTARIAIMAGSEFIVSPNFIEEIAVICNTYAVPYLPGCASVTEITSAMAHGVEVAKVFPGGILGSSFIKDVHGPIPQIEMMPSGGVNLENMEDWVNKGAWAVGVGSALTKGVAENGYGQAVENAKEFSAKYKEIMSK